MLCISSIFESKISIKMKIITKVIKRKEVRDEKGVCGTQ